MFPQPSRRSFLFGAGAFAIIRPQSLMPIKAPKTPNFIIEIRQTETNMRELIVQYKNMYPLIVKYSQLVAQELLKRPALLTTYEKEALQESKQMQAFFQLSNGTPTC